MLPLIERKKIGKGSSIARRSLATSLALQLPSAIAMVDDEVPDQFLIIPFQNPVMTWNSPTTCDQFDFRAARFTHFFATDCAAAQVLPIRPTVLTSTTPTHTTSLVDVAQSLFKTLHHQRSSKHPWKIIQDLCEPQDRPYDTVPPRTPIMSPDIAKRLQSHHLGEEDL